MSSSQAGSEHTPQQTRRPYGSGRQASLDAPVFWFFPKHADLRTPAWKHVTLRHILTMSAGLDGSRAEALTVRGTGPHFFRRVLSRRVVRTPGTKWSYVGANVNLLAGVLYHATGRHADQFAARCLFGPLDIQEWDWDKAAVDGYRSMAGTIAIGSEPESESYGYLWWRLPLPSPDTSEALIVASGWGSQFIYVAPAVDAVLVTTGGNNFNGKTFDLQNVLKRYLKPGFKP